MDTALLNAADPRPPQARFTEAVYGFLKTRKCPYGNGPAQAMFQTLAAGGAQNSHYIYRVMTQAGLFDSRNASEGAGCGSYEELERLFLSLLEQHTKPGLPVVVRSGPEVEQRADGRWYGYFRFVQLDFPCADFFVLWTL